jgi:methionine sulfoxide reductase heme-binding subunit
MSQALWYASRATGLVCLLLLTASMVLGLLGAGRFNASMWPRFVVATLHRNLSLLVVIFLLVHISTAIIDPYAGIGWIDTVVPFVSVYHPLSLGLGAVASDLVLALIVTSLLRSRINLSTWRAVHVTAYACWPVALLHGLAIGGADRHKMWVLGLNGLCVLAVAAASVWRLGASHPDTVARSVDRPVGRRP